MTSAWTAIALATPIFGFSLAPPQLGAPPAGGTSQSSAAPVAFVGDGMLADIDAAAESAAEGDSGASFTEKLRRRARIRRIHKAFGIATWSAMTVTMVLGGIQYHNLYGFGDGRDNNPCVTGDAVFGQGQCTGVPWLHLSSAALTSALYTTTFALSLAMPSPKGLTEGDEDYAQTLRTHKILRWVHLGGMVAQLLLGVVVANGQAFGLDRANDYGALRALSSVHLATGLVTYAALTWAGALMVF